MTVMDMATAMAPLGTLMRGFSRRGSSNSGGKPPSELSKDWPAGPQPLSGLSDTMLVDARLVEAAARLAENGPAQHAATPPKPKTRA